ncbi:MAG TPA: ATP-binding protein [Actinomycetota bacterium]|jgi:two-component system phosphate regulon sensor histidine kinase PhoR|nr:ATP-binding protein [Actinomycetota bacterium]
MAQVAGLLVLGILVGAFVVWATDRGVMRRRLADAQLRVDQATTGRREAERESARRERAQDRILGAMEEGVLLLDPSGTRVYANRALSDLLNGAPDRATELHPLGLQRAVETAKSSGTASRTEVELGSPSRWLRATALPVGADGATLLVIRDVTQARRLTGARRDFVANASHELKTPVASIRAAAETLRDGAIDDPPAARRFTEQLEREAVRMSRIVADLLDLSRLESGSEMDEQVRLDTVAADEVERMGDAAGMRGVTISTDAVHVPAVRGSSRDLSLMVRNLIDNAVRYTGEGGSVTVSVRADADVVLVRVADTGIGIPQRELPRIFERFYRVDRARSRETGGTGLGLSIVRHVTENHGGEVTVESELGQGTVFEVRLPTSPPAA